MMGVLNELDAVAAVIQSVQPTAVIKYRVPKTPKPGDVVIRLQNSDTTGETLNHVRVERVFQVVRYSDDVEDLIDVMDKISDEFNLNGRLSIPLQDGSNRYIRVNGFSWSTPVESEADTFAAVGVLETEVRQARNFEEFATIQKVFSNLTANP